RVSAGCSYRASWRIQSRRGSNHSRMKLPWQVKRANFGKLTVKAVLR
ncbi:hypothetical protein M2308_005891, partial [Rhizobium leguminosarum]|nr:hypothetical protein [Rhizobium leguminosarum]